ncbi:MAG: NAD(P)-dependent oxidoreductase, partial [Flavobacteriales bacterium]
MYRIHANDGIDATGKAALEQLGCVVSTDKIPQQELSAYLEANQVQGLLVRSATTARQDFIDQCPTLRFIGRGGVGIDNIDAAYAREKGLVVFNTPAASSQAVAELVMSHVFAAARGLYLSGGTMPGQGQAEFESLKKSLSKGMELRGKTMGIIGFGRIGQSLASYALGCGMHVIATDQMMSDSCGITLSVAGQPVIVQVPIVPLNDLLAQAHVVSVHVPKQKDGSAVLGLNELTLMRKGSIVVNTSRGGVIDEDALLQKLNDGHLRVACLD